MASRKGRISARAVVTTSARAGQPGTAERILSAGWALHEHVSIPEVGGTWDMLSREILNFGGEMALEKRVMLFESEMKM